MDIAINRLKMWPCSDIHTYIQYSNDFAIIFLLRSIVRSKNLHFIHRYTRKIPEPAPFLFRHGAQSGGLWVFTVIKKSLFVRFVCHLHPWRWTRVKRHTAREDRYCYIVFSVCVYVCVWQKPEDPQFEPNGWRHHYTRRYTRSEISLLSYL